MASVFSECDLIKDQWSHAKGTVYHYFVPMIALKTYGKVIETGFQVFMFPAELPITLNVWIKPPGTGCQPRTVHSAFRRSVARHYRCFS